MLFVCVVNGVHVRCVYFF